MFRLSTFVYLAVFAFGGFLVYTAIKVKSEANTMGANVPAAVQVSNNLASIQD